MATTTQIDISKLASETLQALASDSAVPTELKSAAATELKDREKKSSAPPAVKKASDELGLVAASFASRDPNRLVKAMEKRAAAAGKG